MVQLDWTAVIVAIVTLLGVCAWVVEGRKHKPAANGLKADDRRKNMALGQVYVERFEGNIAEPLRREVRELRDEVNALRNELAAVKGCVCYRADCPNRVSVLE